MTPNDKVRFTQAMAANALVFGRELADETIAIYWAVLREYNIDDISRAFLAHLKKSRFFPTPAELIELIPSSATAKHVGADEAWTIALASFDESRTVVWTHEIAQAKAIVQDIYDAGDTIGARVAFRDAYNRIIATAGRPEWTVCIGWDAKGRADAVLKSVALGRLPAGSEQRYLPSPEPTVTVLALIEAVEKRNDQAFDVEKAKRSIAMLRIAMSGGSDDAIAMREIERSKFEQHRHAELSRLADLARAMH